MDARTALTRRRAELRTKLGKHQLILCNGLEQQRNIPAYQYPFRGSSHFIHFFGKVPAGARALISADSETLYLPTRTPAMEVWEGVQSSFRDYAQMTGCSTILPLDKYADDVAKAQQSALCFLPCSDVQEQKVMEGVAKRAFDPEGRDAEVIEAVIEQRLVHDEYARAELEHAAALTGSAHEELRSALHPGMLETELQAIAEHEIAKHGLPCSFPSIVTTHGNVLHGSAEPRAVAAGELLVVDIGAESPGGYAGDVTRTWPVSGEFREEQQIIFELVAEVQRKAIARVRVGTRYGDIHRAALRDMAEGLRAIGILRGAIDELVEAGAAALFFCHGIGHLIGLDVHDMEDLGDSAGYPRGHKRRADLAHRYLRLDRVLTENMLVSIEPGFYLNDSLLGLEEHKPIVDRFVVQPTLEKFRSVRGIRIEDEVLVTDRGAKILTR